MNKELYEKASDLAFRIKSYMSGDDYNKCIEILESLKADGLVSSVFTDLYSYDIDVIEGLYVESGRSEEKDRSYYLYVVANILNSAYHKYLLPSDNSDKSFVTHYIITIAGLVAISIFIFILILAYLYGK